MKLRDWLKQTKVSITELSKGAGVPRFEILNILFHLNTVSEESAKKIEDYTIGKVTCWEILEPFRLKKN